MASQGDSQMTGSQASQKRKSRLEAKQAAKRQKEEISKLEQKAKDTAHDLHKSSGVKSIQELLAFANVIHRDINDIGVAIQDSRFVGTLGRMGNLWAKNQASNRQQFTSRDFVDRLKQMYSAVSVDDDGGRADADCIDWADLNNDAALYFSFTNSTTFLCGPMCAQSNTKERKARQSAQPKRVVEELEPIVGSGQNDKQDVQPELIKRANQCMELLESGGEIPYIKFFLDPNSFGETIENIHACSHLVSIAKAGLALKQDGKIYIRKTDISEVEATKGMDENTDVKRAIITIDYKKFQDLVKGLGVKEPYFRFDPHGEDVIVGCSTEDPDNQ